jgi:hypothetical protein
LIINISIGDALVAHVTNVTKPTMCWKNFHDVFENSSMTRKILLKNKLNNFRLEEDGSMSGYLN